MFPPRPTELLHRLLIDQIMDGDLVVDATAGNGHDTRFLAEAVGASGKVIAIDIQPEAIDATRLRLLDFKLAQRAELHQECHSKLEVILSGKKPATIVFNLGYLPGGDHQIITCSDTTLKALEISKQCLNERGILAVICYPGHSGGDSEMREVECFMKSLVGFRIACYEILATEKAAPKLFFAQKI